MDTSGADSNGGMAVAPAYVSKAREEY